MFGQKEKAMAEETMERSFAVTSPVSLWVSNIRGSVKIEPGDEDTLLVTAVKDLDSGDARRTELEMAQQADGSVWVKTHFARPWGWWFVRRQPCRVDYTIRVPPACSVTARCVSSSLSVQRLEGRFDLRTVSGPIQASDLRGRIGLDTVSGEVNAERLAGPAEIKTVSGRVSLTGSDLPSVKASTVSGALLLQTPLGEGDYRLKSVSGDVELLLPPGSGCRAEVSSVSGRLRTSLPTTRTWREGGRHGAEIQGGGPYVHLQSVSGDLHIVQPEAEPVRAAASPHERRMALLERIARGEITAEEGLAELRRL